MRKIFLITMIIIFCSSYVIAEDLDGYYWERNMDNLEKTVILSGFLSGFSFGFLEGQIEGIKRSAETLDVKSMSEDKRLKMLVMSSTIISSFNEPMFNEDMQYYVRELDSFLSTFPLCKRILLAHLFQNLTHVWRGEKDYKTIGEECLK